MTATGDDGDLSLEPAAAAEARLELRARMHLRLAARLTILFLRRQGLFLFSHEMLPCTCPGP